MQHPVLGKLTPKEGSEDSYTGEVTYEDRNIAFDIERDADDIEEAINLAVEIIAALSKYDIESKSIISKDLLETYNSGWNEYDESQEDGSFKTVIKPKLSAKEFESQFTLKTVNISGSSCVELWYEENDLFWGHSVFVSTFEGVDFSDAQAQMFG